MDTSLATIVRLAKRRGFIYPGSEIYGGLANSWDYGPLGVLLKNNVRDAWWRRFVRLRADMVAIDPAILMHPKVWEASGHVANFSDPLVEDTVTHKRYRADHLLTEALGQAVDGMSMEEMARAIADQDVRSPDGNTVTAPRQFNLLFETALGPVETQQQHIYLRGELAQAMFVDCKRVAETLRLQVPFGIAAVGRVFRNEITPGNFTFRTLEFDLMEFEYFIREADWEVMFSYWLREMQQWVTDTIGLRADHIRVRDHEQHELSHYSKRTADIEYKTSFGWKELFGLAYRTDFDLRNHAAASGEDLRLTDPVSGEKFYPHVVEPTFGLTRLVLMLLLDAYHEETVRGEVRTVLRIKPQLAPYQAAVLPLSRKEELLAVSEKLAAELRTVMSCDHDVTQSIGKRYRRQDEIGTPYCVTIDFDTLVDQKVTIRERDSMQQERIALARVPEVMQEKLAESFAVFR
ncbi:MAG: glycine--tRNA ligase [Candidatus Andersenbacteria bacterium CG10_big_fil_rev_8_21_14_0_10_54_11]|uniref:glycine--tRNA ligase n=1 Tax=Candidatus Andersenbacteria bacterium CG10_big_fil_rev_8_21_14_0_10_54_11 TaxID=1974485 RepID=A0A2M6X030_9BACT|nr:MAG: glycine--tRNA ligase [Candidatus Andersenbacteria bacterium CG10_big_fil_rev_8_21_14_0_10_54_11]